MTHDKTLEGTRTELHELLQKALIVELTTIPAYATACYSIMEQGQYDRSAPQIVNAEPIEVLRQVMVEEMLHMVLVANVLNAVGGKPVLNDPDLLPRYPCELLDGKGPTLYLRRFTPKQVKAFREVEKGPPDWHNAEKGDYRTIGGFYYWIKFRLQKACEEYGAANLFTGPPGLQIEPGDYYGAGGEVIAVKGDAKQCQERALLALTAIMEEGEGAPFGHAADIRESEAAAHPAAKGLRYVACDGDRIPSPDGEERWDVAHYFKFDEILHSRYYLPTDRIDAPPSGEDLAVDWSAVWPMKDDPKPGDYRDRPEIEALSRQFNLTWTMLLNGLHAALNGEKSELAGLVAHMYQLRNAAQRLIRVPLPSDPGTTAGPTWEYLGSDVAVPRKTAANR
jgi:hypothetical protein